MRPVRLDMTGFATFRNQTVVDFSDADYFALVGATGAGKSTVIDAITFALYATVPRWDNKNMITPALAPTANRGVVRLIFDADGHRYAAVREVRRSGGTTSRVSMKASRLERLLDHNDLDGETELLAADSEVNSKVEDLLGLSLDHFTTCVALPQGRFAEFLHAKPSDRQQILSSLLGHEVYERLRTAAGERGREHDQRAKALTEALENYADATEDAVNGLQARAEQLRQLRTWLTDTGLVDLDAAAAAVTTAQQQLELLTEQHDALTAVAVPHDVASIEADRATAVAELAAAAKTRRDADAALEQSRAALTAHRPRHELTELSRQWEQLDEALTALPGLTEQAETAATERANARAAAADADQVLTELRQAATASAALAEKTAIDLAAAEGDVAALGAIIAPDSLPALAADLAAVKADRDKAQQEIERAEAASAHARAAVDAAPEQATLTAATRNSRTLADALVADLDGWETRASRREELAGATTQLRAAQRGAEDTAAVLEAARLSDQAGSLRAHLQPGQPCPVCEQTVATIPAGHDGTAVRDAEAAHRAALQASSDAASRHARLTQNVEAEQACRGETLRRADEARTELHAVLATLPADAALSSGDTTGRGRRSRKTAAPDGAAVLTALAAPISEISPPEELRATATAADEAGAVFEQTVTRRAELVVALTNAEQARDRAKQQMQRAETRTSELEHQRREAASALLAARDAILYLGAPVVDASDLAAGWRELAEWAAAKQTMRACELDSLRNEAEQTAAAARQAAAALTHAEESVTALRATERRAAEDAATAASRRDQARAQQAKLLTALAEEPTRDQVDTLLAELTGLELTNDAAYRSLTSAGSRYDDAEHALAQVTARADVSWAQLSVARDPLTRYDAPPTSGDDLLAAWQHLTSWAQQQAADLASDLDTARSDADAAEATCRAASDVVRSAVTKVGLDAGAPDSVPSVLRGDAATTVAAAFASAAGAANRAAERLTEQRKLRLQRDSALQSAQVANSLATMLRSDRFQAWLLESALAALVEDASKILLEMSSGQFELRSREKDLQVVDHNDADMLRPVRTLSGGETFQASLALALALSQQVATLAASGAAKLESIFLDEGFGTLDEGSLDVVASTLENLAASGERMVGVVTHVHTLADRIPVRFEVTRTGTSSSIERATA
jgi:exonuclease SbcC